MAEHAAIGAAAHEDGATGTKSLQRLQPIIFRARKATEEAMSRVIEWQRRPSGGHARSRGPLLGSVATLAGVAMFLSLVLTVGAGAENWLSAAADLLAFMHAPASLKSVGVALLSTPVPSR
jgi:hypothetical protein